MHMTQLTQQFIAHPVGQGLFYSGHVSISDNGVPPLPADIFNFVFDCGSLNKTNASDEVVHYRSHRLPEETNLDMLVISHFDADHVSHINELLAGKKVKKLVLPFATLEERLYLVLKYITQRGRGRQGGDSPIGFMLDPLGSLGDNLDDDSTIYIANSDEPKKPFDGPKELTFNESNDVDGNSGNFEFSIPGAEPILSGDNPFEGVNTQVSARIMKFDDSKKGVLNYRVRSGAIMEFLFYRRDLGPQNDAFFKAIYEAFLKKYRLKPSVSLDELNELVKGIRGATNIKKIFRDVKKAFPGIDPPGRDIADLNTTALCMLHYNLKPIYTSILPVLDWDGEINTIKKFDGTNRTRMEEHMCCLYRYIYGPLHEEYPFTRFPNCLLTSDTFLKTTGEVDELYNKYRNYWERFWLFQLPHHGSTASAGVELLNQLPRVQLLAKFISHGAKKIRRWQHPSPQLIADLKAAGHDYHVLPVNEFAGLRFELNGKL